MKLLVCDYDRTLNFDNQVSKQDIISLNGFYDRGNMVAIASSRPFASLFPEMLKNNIPYSLLFCNDGNAVFEAERELIDVNHLNREELIVLRKLIQRLPQGTRIRPCDHFGYRNSINSVYYHISLKKEYNFKDFEESFRLSGLSTDYYAHMGIIFSQRRQKDDAIRFAMKKYGIDYESIYTIGDGDNDYSMLKEFSGYTFPWCTLKVKKLSLPTVNSVSEVIKKIED